MKRNYEDVEVKYVHVDYPVLSNRIPDIDVVGVGLRTNTEIVYLKNLPQVEDSSQIHPFVD